jgi:hypothetical protein
VLIILSSKANLFKSFMNLNKEFYYLSFVKSLVRLISFTMTSSPV